MHLRKCSPSDKYRGAYLAERLAWRELVLAWRELVLTWSVDWPGESWCSPGQLIGLERAGAHLVS